MAVTELRQPARPRPRRSPARIAARTLAASAEMGKPMLSFLFVLAIWAAVGALKLVPEAIFPAPWSVWSATVEMWQTGALPKDLAVSCSRAAIGFAIGASLGVVLGLLTGRVALVRTLLGPFLSLLRPIPAIALVPVAIVWFGIGEGSKYFVISYTVFLAVWFNTHHGMEYVPDIYLRASRSLGASRRREFLTVVIPAAAPYIFAGLRLGVALAFLSLVAAELSGASSGLGYRLQEARQYIRTDRMFSLLIILGALGATVDLIVHLIGRRIVHWQQG
ncbi:ABC transporter permease (plasmid) [Alloyangia pacifica]|uniref:ABC transporter permease n=1 Tax=Alloyangia pacifica TaxID=311180 RepID=A0A2U8HL33_9RHOB|nr:MULTISPECIES: ABC transporter permease [Roseobacteraceae]AWI86451.1 ABC transporter permease [Alloyangia pacifica]NDV48749.1 ABC transporter permease [Salipiger sp. PrR003]NDW31652.1 ABC transporter permease [Salipiger sp. PrR007]